MPVAGGHADQIDGILGLEQELVLQGFTVKMLQGRMESPNHVIGLVFFDPDQREGRAQLLEVMRLWNHNNDEAGDGQYSTKLGGVAWSKDVEQEVDAALCDRYPVFEVCNREADVPVAPGRQAAGVSGAVDAEVL